MNNIWGKESSGKGKEDRSSLNVDLREKGLSGEEKHNRAVWMQIVTFIDPI